MNKPWTPPSDSVGIVTPQDFSFGSRSSGIVLDSGKEFGPINVRYETYGTLNDERSNAVFSGFTA